MRYFVYKTIVFSALVVLAAFSALAALPLQARDSADRFRGELWYLDRISAPTAWNIETGSEETIVAVLDAGFDLDHEDLATQYWHNDRETSSDGVDNDRNGYEDDVMGWDFVDGDPDPSPDFDGAVSDTVASHGTVIAGIIGATANNGLGIAGINWDVSIMPLRVLDSRGAGSTADVRDAIEYAVNNGADVINLSFTFTKTDNRLRDTIEWAHDEGVVIVAAIGNGNIDTDSTPIYPACFDSEVGRNVVIGVAASDRDDRKASFSNYGAGCVDLTAPGTDIFASVYHDPNILSFITSYASPWEGTSLAAPMVSAAAALLRSSYPSLTPDQIRNVLKLSVDSVGETSLEARKRLGAGRLNLFQALQTAQVFALGSGSGKNNKDQPSSGSLVVAQGRGADSTVRRVDGGGNLLSQFQAYPIGFRGGVNLATGDVDGDGEVEIITGAGIGGGPQVRVFDLDGKLENQFFAFDEGDRNGIFVASGDTNNDGMDEIIVTSCMNGTGQVRIFNRYGHLKGAYFPFGRTNNPVRVAIGNIDDDGEQEVLSVLERGGEGSVLAHDGSGRYVRSFVVFGGAVDALSVATIDLEGDGRDEIIVGAGSGEAPRVGVYNDLGVEKLNFFGYQLGFHGGIEVAGADIDGNGLPEIYVFPHSSGGPQVRVFNQEGSVIGGFFPFDPAFRFGGSISIK
jgi:hypothetical protein